MAYPDLSTLSIKEIKAIIFSAGLSHDDCIEKSELLARARQAQNLDRCLPGFMRSGCKRPCCIKQPRCDSADEDEDAEPTTRPTKNARRQAAGGSSTATTSSDGFILPSPPEPPEDLVQAKKRAHDRYEQSRKGERPSRMGHFGERQKNAKVHQVALAANYTPDVDDARLRREPWVATEKYDGIRAVWHPNPPGRGPGFKSRNGIFLNQPPPSLVELLPKDMILDGELWAGRGKTYDTVSRLIATKSLEGGRFFEPAWGCLTFMVFDAPFEGGGYLERLEKARRRLAHVIGKRVRVVTPLPCPDAAKKDSLLNRVTEVGGEGLVLRRAAATWQCGDEKRDLLKVKRWFDAEAMVIEYRRAPSCSNMPTLLCRALDPEEAEMFEVTCSREMTPPAKGTIVTFIHRQLLANGTFYQPHLTRVHPDSCDCNACAP